ncbi:MAG: sulfatase-like hydrolase/transferase, partial [Myxococcota bacterium]|nr:sulfatase-like hydrolase/transferase [Myxococcota bacterium]
VLAGRVRHGYPIPMRLLLALLLWPVLHGCHDEPSTSAVAPAVRPNVLLISLDTTRADALACYGNKVAATPVLDALAQQGTRFSRAFSVTPLTIPAHSSLFTGLYPPRHGVRDNGDFFLGPEAVTLAERLQEAGYATAASVGAEVTTHRWGFGQGFEAYFDEMGETAADAGSRWKVERRGDLVVDDALSWLKPRVEEGAGRQRKPWFAWVHLFDVHHPYEPPAPYDELFSNQPYLGEVAWVDEQVGRLVAALEEADALDDTWVFVVADHGEGMGSHGELLHGVLLYNATVRIPFIVRPPGGRAAPSFEHFPVSLVDVAPTILALAGVDGAGDMDGIDLSPWLDPGQVGPLPPSDRAVYVESLYAFRHYGWAGQRAVVTAETKLIDSTTPELYRRDDYAEAANRAEDDPGLVREMHTRAAEISARLAEATTAQGAQLDADQLAQLEALGYVTAAANAPSEGDGFERGLPDPVRRLPVLRDVERARQALQQGELEEALRRLDAVLATDPGLVQPQQMRAQVLWRTGRATEALEAFERLNAQTRSAGVEVSLGSLKRSLGRTEEALVHYEAALEMEPYLETAWRPYLRTLFSAGREDALLDALEAVRERRPELGTAQVIAAMVALERGASGAERVLSAVSQTHPDEPGARTLLAARARRRGDNERAIRLLREELALPTGLPGVRMALVEVLASEKRYAEQLEELERVLQDTPGDPVVLHARAQALFNLDRYEEALSAAAACLDITAVGADCKLLQANALKKLGRDAEAEAAWRAARALKERTEAK